MQSSEIRQKFLKFFEKRGHVAIPSASLVPDGDNSVLFTTAGMQPLIPYLLGKSHPEGKRLVNIQKCVRTQDIDEVGDNTHDTFFEMLGNWSLGDFFKEDAIKWSFELLTSKKEGFGLDPNRLHFTVFAGDEFAPPDEESAGIWEKIGVAKEKIKYLSAADNWWPARKAGFNWTGPTGPCTEMFYDDVEIWNDVFMEYSAQDGKITGKLSQKNVDTGAGLERLSMVLQNKNNIFETDLFQPIMAVAKSRIVADHIRTSCFMISDGVIPANTGRGYILRRLLRRAYVRNKDVNPVIDAVVNHESYKNLYTFAPNIKDVVSGELDKFGKTLEAGLKQVEKGEDPFVLFTSYGLPLEIIKELVPNIDEAKFQKQMSEHKRVSSTAGEQKFKK